MKSILTNYPERPIRKTVYISYGECVLKGDWNERLYKSDYESQYYIAKSDQAELWLVRSNGLKRAFRFKVDSEIKVRQRAIKFFSDDMIEELAVDEDERQGRLPRNKLNFD